VPERGIREADAAQPRHQPGDRGAEIDLRLMRRGEFAEQREIHAVGARIRRGGGVDRDLGPRHRRGDRVGQVAHLMVARIGAGIDHQHPPALFRAAQAGPFDRARHVAHVDQRAPGRAVRQHRDPPGGERAGDEIIQHEIEPQPRGKPAGGGEAQAGRGHARQLHLPQPLLGRDLGAGIGGQRPDRIALAPRAGIGRAIDAAA
jgi:hypothetical protein